MESAVKIIRGGILIDGTGKDPLKNAVVVVKGKRIEDVGVEGKVRVPEGKVIDAKGKIVMPGLIDIHVHTSLSSWTPAGAMRTCLQPLALTVLEAERNLQRTLEAGYTTIKENGAVDSVDIALRKAIEIGMILGPRMICCGKALTITGGHADNYFYFPSNIPTPHSWGVVCNGVDEVRKAAREEIKAGADWIKLLHAGVASYEPVPGSAQFTIEEMQTACDVAHRAGKKVCCHAQGIQAIKDSILAGVDTVEHGNQLDEEAAEMMVERNIPLVINLGSGYRIRHKTFEDLMKEGIPEKIARKYRMPIFQYETRRKSVQLAKKEGVTIVAISDAVGENCGVVNAMELFCLVDAGLSPMEAVIAGTRTPAEVLQIDAGTIEPGKLADIIIVDGNPIENISILQDRARIKMVMKEGEVAIRR